MIRRILTSLALMAVLGLGLMLSSPAVAHTRSESHSNWLVDGSSVHLTFSVADLEAKRLTRDQRVPSSAQLISYLTPRETVSAGGKPCRLAVAPKPVAAAPGYHRIEFLFDCPSANGLVLHSAALFDLVPTHVNLAQIQTATGDFAEQVLTAQAQDVAMAGENGEGLESAGFPTFVEMGIMHIFTGIDHMSFLLGLVLISRRFRDLAFVITGFTIGHSLTLALAFTGIIRPHAEFIDALVALTIALIGIENISVVTRRPGLLALWTGGGLIAMFCLCLLGVGLLPPLLLLGAGLFSANYLMVSGHIRDAARLRLVVTLVFGLIHGFGFAADLLSQPMPPDRLAQLLIGFNVGVEIGQLTVVTVLAGAVVGLRRMKLTLPRPIVVDVTAACLVAVGLHWFIERSFA